MLSRMSSPPPKVIAEPIKGHRWSVEPITHKFTSDENRDCLVLATGIWKVLLTFGFTIGFFLFVSGVAGHESLVLCVSPLGAAVLTMLALRFYRSLFWQLAFDRTRMTLEVWRCGHTETVPASDILGLQVCQYIDESNIRFLRYRNGLYQLIIAYNFRGELKRRLLTSTRYHSEILELVRPFSSSTSIPIQDYAA